MTATQAPTPGPLSKSLGQKAYERMRDHNDNALPEMNDSTAWESLTPSQRRSWEEDASERPHLYGLAPTAPVEASGSEREVDGVWVSRETLAPFAYFATRGTSREFINSDAPDSGLCAAASFPAGAYRGVLKALSDTQYRSLGQVAYEGWAQGLSGAEWSNQTATQKRAWDKAAEAVLSLRPQPSGAERWTEDMERQRREADYERGFRNGKEAAYSEAGSTPAAWRGRDLDAFGDGAWAVCSFKPSCDEVEPLYTQPFHPQPSGETREAFEKLASIVERQDEGYRGKLNSVPVSHLEELKYGDILALLSARPLALGGQHSGGEGFQPRVHQWLLDCFGWEIAGDRQERGDRLLEEVLELLQSGGYDPARVAALRDYVWGRPVGEPAQEVGGVMVTLAAYCVAHDLDMIAAGETELARIVRPEIVEKIRAKQAAKPTGSALPIAVTIPARAEAQAEGAAGEPRLDVLASMRDHYQFALSGQWQGVKTPHYALAGLFKMAGDEIERLRTAPPSPPAAADEDKARIAVTEAVSKGLDNEWKDWEITDAVLAALKSEGK